MALEIVWTESQRWANEAEVPEWSGAGRSQAFFGPLSVSCRGAGSLTPGTGTGQAGRGPESLLLRKEETVSPLTVFCLAPLKEWASRLFPGVPASPCLTVVALGRHFQARGREVASSSVPRTGSSEKED